MDIKTNPENTRNFFIETFTGKKFYVGRVVEKEAILDICIEDIAHALSMECRYGGHCRDFYSVAEHSCHVFDLWLELVSFRNHKHDLHVLLHDAHEAYFKDIPYPIKKLPSMNGYGILCEACQEHILDRFNASPSLPPEHKELLKKIDTYLRYVEAQKLMITGGKSWDWPTDKKEYMIYKEIEENEAYSEKIEWKVNLKLWEPSEAKKEFTDRFMSCW